MTNIPNQEMQFRSNWRDQLGQAIIERRLDDSTLLDMLMAGLNQAHYEGIEDAARMCEDRARFNPFAKVLADEMRNINLQNARSRAEIAVLHHLVIPPGVRPS